MILSCSFDDLCQAIDLHPHACANWREIPRPSPAFLPLWTVTEDCFVLSASCFLEGVLGCQHWQKAPIGFAASDHTTKLVILDHYELQHQGDYSKTMTGYLHLSEAKRVASVGYNRPPYLEKALALLKERGDVFVPITLFLYEFNNDLYPRIRFLTDLDPV